MHQTVEGQVGPLAVSWQAHPSQDKLAWPAPFKMECERIGAVLQTRMSGMRTCSETPTPRGSLTWLAYLAPLVITACCTCRLHNMQAPLEAARPSAAHAVAWRGPPQDNIDWSSSLASQGLSNEAPGVFTITDRKVRMQTCTRHPSYSVSNLHQHCYLPPLCIHTLVYRCVVGTTHLTFPSTHCADAGFEMIHTMMKPPWRNRGYLPCLPASVCMSMAVNLPPTCTA